MCVCRKEVDLHTLASYMRYICVELSTYSCSLLNYKERTPPDVTWRTVRKREKNTGIMIRPI